MYKRIFYMFFIINCMGMSKNAQADYYCACIEQEATKNGYMVDYYYCPTQIFNTKSDCQGYCNGKCPHYNKSGYTCSGWTASDSSKQQEMCNCNYWTGGCINFSSSSVKESKKE